MRYKNPGKKAVIEQFVNDFFDRNLKSPTMMEIEKGTGISRQTACRYLKEMNDEGVLEYDSRRIVTGHIRAMSEQSVSRLPLAGPVSCGEPMEENEENREYIDVPASFTGAGEHYALLANGDSMSGAGIDDGDIVIIKKTAETPPYGKIVVALDENGENTLKRLAYDSETGRPYLHPENVKYGDIYPAELIIRGVAVKVIKDLM